MATNKDPQPQPGLSKRTRTILISAAGGLSTYGVVLQLQDADDTGADDEVGTALQIASDVFRKVASGKIAGRDTITKAIADGLYLSLGITPAED